MEFNLDSMFRTRVTARQRPGAMAAVYPQWDDRAHSQQRWDSSQNNTVLVFDKDTTYAHVDGDVFYNEIWIGYIRQSYPTPILPPPDCGV